MNRREAEIVIESLRKGIPPEGKVSLLTVGRKDEIERLRRILQIGGPGALLVEADYGAGKTHLLKFIKEEALRMGFVTSLIKLDSKSQARFNRMDQIFGEVCRNIQVPDDNKKGVRHLLNALFDSSNQRMDLPNAKVLMTKISNRGRWDYSEFLHSPAMFVAVRAWRFSYINNHAFGIDDVIEDWLSNPFNYYSRRKELYQQLVESMRGWVNDPRPEWVFYDAEKGIFNFQAQEYKQSWDALNDLNTLALAAGYRGLVILVDEFEDVIYNLDRINYKENAFRNLFRFFSREYYPNLAFFAVTPDFVENCKNVLLDKGRWNYSYSRFDKLEKFKMSPLTKAELLELTEKIILIHETAYSRRINEATKRKAYEVCRKASNVSVADRVRQAIIAVVKTLDNSIGD